MRTPTFAMFLMIMCGQAFAQGAYNPSTNLPFLTLVSPGLSLNPVFSLTQNVAGSFPAGDVFLNPSIVNIGALSSPGNNVWGQGTRCNVTSAAFTSQLLCGYQDLFVTAIGTPGFPNDQYTAQFSRAVAQPGADSLDNDATLEAGNDNVVMFANGWKYIVGREIDMTVDALNIVNKIGLNIVQGVTDIVQGSGIDAAIRVADNVGAVGWKSILNLDSTTSAPLNTNGTVIKTTGSQTFTAGVDFSSATITGNAWNSPGCIIGGTGSLNCQNYTGGTITGGNFFVTGAGSAYYNMNDSSAGTDLKNWQNGSQGGVEYFTAVNDANSSVNIWMQVNRTGFVPNLVTITPPLTVTGDVKTPAHLLNNSSVPTISTCGTSPPAATAGSSNAAGQFTIGTGGTATACTVTFAVAYPTTAFCTVSPVSSTITAVRVSSQSKTAFTITFAPATTSQVFQYTCGGN